MIPAAPRLRLARAVETLAPLVLRLRFLLSAGIAPALIAAIGVQSSRAADAPPLDHVVLQLKWQHQFQFAGYYAAAEMGYYRDAGLDVELREAAVDQDPVKEVISGRAQFGVGTSELVLLRSQRQPVVVLAAIFQHSPLVLLARRDAGITDLHDLHDKPIMVEPQSAELFAYLKYEGVDPQHLRVEPHTFSAQDLISGRVAAMSAYSTDEPYALRVAKIPFLTFTPRAGGIDFYGDNLFTTEAEIRAHPARVRAFRQASMKGWEYAVTHRAEIVDLILRDYSKRKTRDQLLFEADQTAQLMHVDLIEPGHMNPGRWQHIVDTYADLKMLPRGFSLVGFLYQPDRQPDIRWFYWLLVGVSVLALAGFGWALPLLRLNRRLARSEREFRELVENAPFPVAITDLETSRVKFVNRRALALFGNTADPEDLLDEPASTFYRDAHDRERLIAELRSGQMVTEWEVGFQSRDGREIWTSLSAGVVEFQGVRAVVGAFHDITHRRAMEGELRRAKEAAETANAAKTRYLAVLSHEIRTPVNGMLGMITLLRDEPLPESAAESLETLARSGDALLKLINDLLDFARYDSGRVELEKLRLDLPDFLRELCTLFRPAAEAKGLELRYELRPDVPSVILTDPMRLRQVLSNLVANAVKFTHGGSIEVTVESAPQATRNERGRRLRFHVSDTGIGIPRDKWGQLFEPHVQGDASVARKFGGSGLGLSISKRLAQLLGGTIGVQSTLGAGSMFTVEIEVELP